QIGPQPIVVDTPVPTPTPTVNPQAPSNVLFQGAGPDSGEVVDIAIDPRGTSDQTVYIATNDGGIWKTTNGGTSWTPLTDNLPSLSMGAVALDPGNPNIVYAGTGNNFDGGSLFNKGVGLYQSIDGGQTWSVLGGSVFGGASSNPQGIGINRIVLPASGVLVVGTNNGVYYSNNGGQTFGSNAPSYNNGQPVLPGFAFNVALDTAAVPSASS